jgi:hypothetical protein
MRVFACYVVSKLQRNRCPTFRDFRSSTNAPQTELHFYIYRLIQLRSVNEMTEIVSDMPTPEFGDESP